MKALLLDELTLEYTIPLTKFIVEYPDLIDVAGYYDERDKQGRACPNEEQLLLNPFGW